MTLDEMISELDLYGFEDLEDDQKTLLLDEAYFDIVTREPWPFLENIIQFNKTDGLARVNVVTDELTGDEITLEDTLGAVLSFTDISNQWIVTPERTDVIEQNYKLDALDDLTSHYYFVGYKLFLWPPPAGATTYRMWYTKRPQSLQVENLLPASHHSVIVYGALIKAYLVNDEPQAAVFQNLFEQKYQAMRNDVWMRQYDRTERIHVITDSTDWNY